MGSHGPHEGLHGCWQAQGVWVNVVPALQHTNDAASCTAREETEKNRTQTRRQGQGRRKVSDARRDGLWKESNVGSNTPISLTHTTKA